jgi:hypothetical protein
VTTYRGHFERGKVVLDESAVVPDGTPATIQVEQPTPPPPSKPARGSPQAVLASDVRWIGDAAELEHLLTEVQKVRDEDLELERQAGE